MRQREYKALCKAIGCFTDDFGWQDGMEILSELKESHEREAEKRTQGTPAKRDIFSLEEGAATLSCPGDLSDEDREDVSAWLELILIQLRRPMVGKDEPPPDAPPSRPCAISHPQP